MPVVFGHKLRWVEDTVPCTVCSAEHDGRWIMVKNFTTGDLYCRDCLETWREERRPEWEREEAARKHFSTHRPME